MKLFIEHWCNFEWKGMVMTEYYMDGTMIVLDLTGEVPVSIKRKVGQKETYAI